MQWWSWDRLLVKMYCFHLIIFQHFIASQFYILVSFKVICSVLPLQLIIVHIIRWVFEFYFCFIIHIRGAMKCARLLKCFTRIFTLAYLKLFYSILLARIFHPCITYEIYFLFLNQFTWYKKCWGFYL